MRTIIAVLAAATAAVTMARPVPPEMTCTYSNQGAAYDLTDWSTSQTITVRDSRYDPFDNNENGELLYGFAICNNANPIPMTDLCHTTTGDQSNEVTSGPSPAFQWYDPDSGHSGTDKCWRLGADVTQTGNAVWGSLFGGHTTNPSEGVALTYANGNTCQLNDGSYVHRNITMHLECDPQAGSGSNVFNVTVIENPTCSYHVILHSKYGCPTQCRDLTNNRLGGTICSGNGVCDYDKTNSQAKCFCNIGWHGDFCEQEGSPPTPSLASHGGEIFGFLFLGVVIGVAVGGGAYYWFVVRVGGHPTNAGFAQMDDNGVAPSSGGGYAPPTEHDDDAPML